MLIFGAKGFAIEVLNILSENQYKENVVFYVVLFVKVGLYDRTHGTNILKIIVTAILLKLPLILQL